MWLLKPGGIRLWIARLGAPRHWRRLRRFTGPGWTGVFVGVAALAGIWVSAASADSPAVPGADATGSAPPAGVQPSHIPPTLVGMVRSIAPGASGLQIAVGPRVAAGGGPLNITLRSYTHVYQLSPIQQGTLQHGDSVLVQGRAGADPDSFQGARVLRLARKLPLAPGVDLVDAPAQMAPTGPSDAFGTLGQEVQSSGKPDSGLSGLGVKQKVALRAQRALQRAKQRGQLPGLVVSAQPLVVEVATGETLTVQTAPATLYLDQQPSSAADLKPGSVVQVRGSETGPGQYRASEINILPPGFQALQANPNRPRPAQRRGLLRRPSPFAAPNPLQGLAINPTGRVAYPMPGPGFATRPVRTPAPATRTFLRVPRLRSHPQPTGLRLLRRLLRTAYRVKR